MQNLNLQVNTNVNIVQGKVSNFQQNVLLKMCVSFVIFACQTAPNWRKIISLTAVCITRRQ